MPCRPLAAAAASPGGCALVPHAGEQADDATSECASRGNHGGTCGGGARAGPRGGASASRRAARVRAAGGARGLERVQYASGDEYAGEVAGGMAAGLGVYAFAGGGRYEGEVGHRAPPARNDTETGHPLHGRRAERSACPPGRARLHHKWRYHPRSRPIYEGGTCLLTLGYPDPTHARPHTCARTQLVEAIPSGPQAAQAPRASPQGTPARRARSWWRPSPQVPRPLRSPGHPLKAPPHAARAAGGGPLRGRGRGDVPGRRRVHRRLRGRAARGRGRVPLWQRRLL